MSLMLEALRKAERQARPGAAGVKPVVRESAEPRGARGYAELTLEPVPELVPPAASIETGTAPETRVAIGDKAVLAAEGADAPSETDARPRQPFVLALGLLGVLAIGTIAYFWLQLQPHPTANAAKPARVAESGSATPAAPPATDETLPGLPPLPAARAIEPARAAPIVAASPMISPRSTTVPALSPTARPAPAIAARPSHARVDDARIHGQVQSGYAAYQAGELAVARAAYEQALRDEPRNRDALLGLAAVEVRTQRFAQAEALYEELLQMFPRDPHGIAGLIALRAERVDPLQAESSLKTLLAAEPDAALLQFSLGNQFARQSRWAEAQQAFARAQSGDPDNPDAAFNLAISLDRLHQPAAAKEQYERALRLAERRVASFSPEVARQRLLQLSN